MPQPGGKGRKLMIEVEDESEDLFASQDPLGTALPDQDSSSSEEEETQEDDNTQLPSVEEDEENSQAFEGQIDEGAPVPGSSSAPGHTPPGSPELPRPNKRQKRVYHIIPSNYEQDVVEWWRENELFYNKKVHAYRDKDRKIATLAAKAKQLDVERKFSFKILSN